jgi:hypothetical protein
LIFDSCDYYGAVANPLLQKIFRQFVFQGRSGYKYRLEAKKTN